MNKIKNVPAPRLGPRMATADLGGDGGGDRFGRRWGRRGRDHEWLWRIWLEQSPSLAGCDTYVSGGFGQDIRQRLQHRGRDRGGGFGWDSR